MSYRSFRGFRGLGVSGFRGFRGFGFRGLGFRVLGFHRNIVITLKSRILIIRTPQNEVPPNCRKLRLHRYLKLEHDLCF